MSLKSLSDLSSFINDSPNAKDNERVFTYIEFVKEFGYDNSPGVFLNFYKEYLTSWNNKKKNDIKKSSDDFVTEKMMEILKSITLDYSSYEEQDYISHVNWNDMSQVKGLVTYYSRKIREITEFYRKKRNDSHLIVKRNSMRGSTKSIEEIIYNKILDFVFNNRHVIPSYNNIRRDLIVSVESFVDTYSEYFDIPRNKDFSDRERQEMLSANMNDVDYRDYLEISLVMSELLFSGNVYLKEIPLIAQLGLDLSQSCVGDMLALKNTLVANTTINQIPLSEQVALKRKLYEKYLGCDLYYMYVDLQKNIKIDRLCKAKNPTGNLLNCGSVDTATIESGQLELLSHIGLFFKPDKTSILKVSAKDFTWNVNEDKIEADTIYIFPDPSKYGDIGNNKNNSYPLIMEYKMDYDIRNISSGDSSDDPLLLITDQGWRTYYSKQDDDFKLINNINYEYAFTSLVNKGIISSYQTDVWGNQFGLFKGCTEVYKKDENGNIIYENGKAVLEKIQVPSKFNQSISKKEEEFDNNGSPMIINGGYMEDPYRQGKNYYDEYVYYSDIEYNKIDSIKLFYCDENKNIIGSNNGNDILIKRDDENLDFTKNRIFIKAIDKYGTVNANDYFVGVIPPRKYVPQFEIDLYSPEEVERYYKKVVEKTKMYGYLRKDDGGVPFDFTKYLLVNSKYRWSGLKNDNPMFYIPDKVFNHLIFGEFGTTKDIQYVDNYGVTKKGLYIDSEDVEEGLLNSSLEYFFSSIIDEDNPGDIEIESIEMDIESFRNSSGTLYIRNSSSTDNKPKKFTDYFDWMDNLIDDKKIINIQVIHETVLVETENDIFFVKYTYDGKQFSNPLVNKEILNISKKNPYYTVIGTNYYYVEKEKSFYICQLELVSGTSNINIHIFKFDCVNYTMEEKINFFDSINVAEYEKERLDTNKIWSTYINKKNEINKRLINSPQILNLMSGLNERYPNFGDLNIPYMKSYDIGTISFTYNSSLKMYLLSFVVTDLNGSPFLYECKFRLNNIDDMHDTMVTNLYSIGGSNLDYDVESRYFENMNSESSICFPDNKTTNPIFELKTS